MMHSRRQFLERAIALTAGFHGLRSLIATGGPISARQPDESLTDGLGPLVADPQRILDLPTGFRYSIVSVRGEPMDDGLLVPGQPDGMGAFPGPDGKVILIRNHENEAKWFDRGPFGKGNERLGRFDNSLLYDAGSPKKRPALGGTTTVVYNPATRRAERQFLSLAGTEYNCGGGHTPWGTWISCEESTRRAGEESGADRDHGYAFEVSPSLDAPTRPRALTAMGRFRREAVAIDPRSGVVYQTEDIGDGLFYRFIPTRPGDLAAGGRVQALAAIDRPSLDTRNWLDEKTRQPVSTVVATGTRLPVRWIDLDELDSPKDDLRLRGFAAGAARFARQEGAWFGHGVVFFAATTGGRAQKGQVWKYTPSPAEGTSRETDSPGTLELFIEPNDAALIDNCDNLTIAPWGDLILCEDACDSGDVENFMVGVTPKGGLYKLARNGDTKSEFAGAVFSPDGRTLFVNLQDIGLTLAITGPWPRASESKA